MVDLRILWLIIPLHCGRDRPASSASLLAVDIAISDDVWRSSSMVATVDKVFAGSIPDLYERFLVPLIFESYALDLAARLAKTRPAAVLETAAGTGVLTRALAAALPAQTRLTITDLNQPMLDHAKSRQPADSRIAWQQAD